MTIDRKTTGIMFHLNTPICHDVPREYKKPSLSEAERRILEKTLLRGVMKDEEDKIVGEATWE